MTTKDSTKYDDLYRLETTNYEGNNTQTESFQYDLMGNRINHNRSGYNYKPGQIIEEGETPELPAMVIEEDTEPEAEETIDIIANLFSGDNFEYPETYTGEETIKFPTEEERNAGFTGEEYSPEIIVTDTILQEFYDDSTAYETNNLNQYTSLSGSSNFEIEYDNAGNIVDNGKYSFEYDYKNRVRNVECGIINDKCSVGELVVSFDYDILGRKISKESSEKSISYVYSNNDMVQEIETLSGSTVEKNYINGLGVDDLIAYELENEIFYYHRNHLGSVVALSDSEGEVVIEYDYDVFGKVYVESLSGSIAIENYEGNDYSNYRLFTSREWDVEVGLYYYRARFYDAEIGRFISRDPIGVKDDVNLYAYVGNSPVMFVDAMGLAKELMLQIFKNAITDFEHHKDEGFFEKKESWGDFNIGDYDLIHNLLWREDYENNKDFFHTELYEDNDGKEREKITEIKLDGKWYSMGEVTNVLVGFNAYNIGYSYKFLREGAMVWNVIEEYTESNKGNGIEGEYLDGRLYLAGHNLSKTIDGDDTKLSIENMMNAIEQGRLIF